MGKIKNLSLARVAPLINKRNQFHSTKTRYSEPRIDNEAFKHYGKFLEESKNR